MSRLPRKNPTALVAGAGGFIGSHLVDALLQRGYRVIGVDNFITGSRNHLLHFKDHPNFFFIEQDICEPIQVEERFSWIFHLASPASPPRYLEHPLVTLRTNALGTENLLRLAREHNANFFLASSSEVYGDPEVHPQREDYWGHVNPIGPRSVYDEGKRFAEAMTFAWHRKYGLSIRIARIFNTYGPRMDPEDGRVVSNFIVQALKGEPLTIYGDGTQTRSFMYIDDLISGILRLMEVEDPYPVNLGNPQESTILDLARKIEHLLQRKLELRFLPLPQDDPKRRKPDITRAREILSWEPRISLDEGLKRTINYFQTLLGDPQRLKEAHYARSG